MNKWRKAIESGDINAIRRLLGKNAPDDLDAGSGESLLAAASDAGQTNVVRVLLQAGADPNYPGTTLWPLLAAAGKGNVDIVRLLLEAGADPNAVDEEGCNPLFGAAAGGHATVVEQLLDAGSDPKCTDESGQSPIFLAVQRGFDDVIELLLPHTTKFDRRRIDLVRRLAKQGTISEEAQTFLQSAKRGEIDVVLTYLDKGGDVNVVDESGMSALSWAACRYQVETARLLVTRGTDVNQIDVYGNFPLNFANSPELIDLLHPLTSTELISEWERNIRRMAKVAAASPYVTDENMVRMKQCYGKYVNDI